MPDKKAPFKKSNEVLPKEESTLKGVENFIAHRMKELPVEFERNKIKSDNIRKDVEERRERLQDALRRPKSKFSL